jgi:hypothetical protein
MNTETDSPVYIYPGQGFMRHHGKPPFCLKADLIAQLAHDPLAVQVTKRDNL